MAARPPLRMHVIGASGSGTSTLGEALAARLGLPWHDTDDFYWVPTDPPYTTRRPVPERLARMNAALDDSRGWVMSGSLISWGDSLTERLTFVVFLALDQGERMRRLRAREASRYGRRIGPGGDMHQGSVSFLDWAASYDTAGLETRSRRSQEAWLARLHCPLLRLDSLMPVGTLVEAVLARLEQGGRD
ncbi:hypothetical protein LPC08_18505 [Roseomonas sp. OT10]|uniref:hypothetical protein n=1 Tax=Roseomonas cutis TaxID=2897332 RepID=UPI001E30EB82|nr:hypothetical protein [Roseomonas sp. OT10]UFN47988.1 hypothetical protein LPC08_18505 [Roseomonas sp. OT10]